VSAVNGMGNCAGRQRIADQVHGFNAGSGPIGAAGQQRAVQFAVPEARPDHYQ